MKNSKRLKRRHKEFLVEQGLNHHNYFIIKDLAECYQFYHKITGKVVNIRR
ncbi:DUF6906 family protein [Clostridium sp. M14]|uniref:DUF6906 family protein n=1 Tax=Clostridium sp. M14 TaxID=2716311 RepID=UPI0013EE42E2|nr:hypothetical protein [Clostridium sp. M14]MBZ9690688.1 hypothetical protein [Clostridium sp. M14]